MTQRKTRRDPFAEREARKYARPVPSRELILSIMSEQPGPLDLSELLECLQVVAPEDIDALTRRLKAMERDGQIVRNRRGGYLPVDESDLIRGRVIGHPDGFGFLVPDEGHEDLFLSPREMRALMHGDRALVRVIRIDRRGRKEAALVEVLERHNEQVVGRFFKERGIGFVRPDNKRLHQDILIPPENMGSAGDSQIVMAAIVEQPNQRSQPIGRIVEVLGDHMAPGMEIDVAVRAHALPYEWPEDVLTEAAHVKPEIPEPDKQGRVDLRDVPLVTIDSQSAMDFDDAVYCEPAGGGWRLLVAIADVSAYVLPGTALDAEAQRRGNSVYFPGRVIPMLPETLSNGLCSLNPEADRLCMVCEMRINADGKHGRYRFFEAVMRSAARLTYTEVAAMVVDRRMAPRRKYTGLVSHLDDLYALYKVLRKRRERRGAIDFETMETEFLFSPDRKIERIMPAQRNDAHKLIEECMIAANVAVADFLRKRKMPVLYRVHEGPDADKLADLRDFLDEFGLTLGGGDSPEPKDYAKLVDKVISRPDAHLIQTVLLRSLSQAVYSPENRGHFGLALPAYVHFTSPIRRYPDLLVHRAIRHALRNRRPTTFEYSFDTMLTLGEHCSMTERRADEATHDVEAWLKCEYMQDKVGEEFDGIISGVTSFGVFVELNEIYVEGLVHITSLPRDYYHFDPIGHRLSGERSHRIYRLGDKLRVKIARVDLDERRIDLEPVEARSVRGKGRRALLKKKRA
ncbi:MAG TPA: ribonuclease R [Gammaproteobacteria bacterium]|nr:ribonuclease R [Gammaproteobacteria bacterium]